MKCSVTYCHNEQQESGASDEKAITFHSFPKIAQYRDEWVEALGIPFWAPSKHSIVCSEHFKKDDFCLTRGGLKKLKNGVVPTILHTKQDDMDESASFKVCRICLASKCKMYHIGEHSLDQIYEQITGCSVSTTDKLPQSVCWECAHRLRAAGRLRRLAQGTEVMLLDVLQTAHYISLQDIKSILNTNKNIKSNLVIKHKYENNFDYEIKDDQILVKTEETIDNDDEDYKEDNNKELTVNGEIINDNSAVFTEVPIKDESNDIYLDEFNDFDDSDDNVKLSEVYKPKTKVKRKKIKLVKKVKEQAPKVNKKEKEKEKEEDATPTSTVDKYKTSGVKRRKNLDLIDENLFTITAMTYEEQIAEINKRQENHNYKSAPFKCDICFRGFMVKGRYDVHAIRHSEACGAYECFICKTRMKSARSLRKHLTGQHTEKFSCNGCSFITRNRGVAREHQKWHSGTKYQCPHCPAEFDKLTTYMGHIRIKHVSDFICELCGFTFVSKRGIEVHKYRKHRTTDSEVLLEGPYCETCDVKFISEEAHDRHLKLSSRHSTDNDPNRLRNDSQSVYCDNKGRAVTERRTNIHPRERGESDCGQPVTCEQCGAVLRDLRLYAQHFRRAHPDKNRTKYPAMKTPAMCELCGRIFQSMALLKDHMWVHTGEKRFKCDRCDKSFTQKTNLVFHMRVHSAHRPSYECPLCGKHFAFYNNRRRHMFIHTGLKPFKCDTCGKSFTTSGEQRAHVEHVHLKKPWPKRARHRPGDEWKCTSED